MGLTFRGRCLLIVFVLVIFVLLLFQIQLQFDHSMSFTQRQLSTSFYEEQVLLSASRKMFIKCNIPSDMLETNVTVLLDAGLPFSSSTFGGVLEEFQKASNMLGNLRVCAFDRLGYGWSSAVSGPRDTDTLIEELREALQVVNFKPPYLYVGWSFGGLLGQYYARKHPEEISGLVLVDSMDIGQLEDEEFLQNLDLGLTSFNIMRHISSFGAYLIFGNLGVLPFDSGYPTFKVPRSIGDPVRDFASVSFFPHAAYNELLYLTISLNQTKEILSKGNFGQLPLVAVSSNEQPSIDQQQVFLNMSERSVAIIAEKSDHFIPFWQPEKIMQAISICASSIILPP
eukprot:TRINITY_DN19709_c0_g1_i1.p1 TRINITY_DN19709_c0_g1~~TRINITY_DN19709_c0_g1_i1.p1  ORF type:complete len:341 (+),score=32.42 TRINITY_DN19709_c0_g1_i1:76-1098(+)